MEPGDRDESRTVSETRIRGAGTDRGRVAFALNQAESYIARSGPSPARRRLGLALETARRTVDSWSSIAPTEEQVRFMLEHVLELRDQARDDVPTLRLRRSA
jgi:hypothetical protein